MKTLLAVLAIVCCSFVSTNNSTSWKSSDYMILDDYGIHKYKTASYCTYNEGAFAFYTEQSGLQSFNWTEKDNTIVKGKPVKTFISPNNEWIVELKLPYSIEIQKTTGYSRTFILKAIKFYDSDYNKFMEAFKDKTK